MTIIGHKNWQFRDGKKPYEYIGLSTDAKPMTGVPDGSTFTEIDSGLKFTFLSGAWHETAIEFPFANMQGPSVTYNGDDTIDTMVWTGQGKIVSDHLIYAAGKYVNTVRIITNI